MDLGLRPLSHCTVGVALSAPRSPSGKLSSSCEELPASEAASPVHLVSCFVFRA